MRKRRIGWRFGLVGCGIVVVLAGIATVGTQWSSWSRSYRRSIMASVSTVEVRRTDLTVQLTTGGRIDSSERTTIECELEALDVSVRGNRMGTNGASTILSIAPDGATVKKGDVLAVLDSSDYEEILRTQQMNVDRVTADHQVADLNLQAAETAFIEFRDGLRLQNIKTMEGQIALAESEYERSLDRLGWTRKMVGKGYLPKVQCTVDESSMNRMAFDLKKSKTTLRMFKEFNAPIYLRILEGDVKAAEIVLSYQDQRLKRNQSRLDYVKLQVERCTIRAPHDGFAINAQDQQGPPIRIEAGMTVRQRQRLFYLPNLSKMEVAAVLHESVVREVKPGMRATVKVEALAGRTLEGHVVSITQLPAQNNFFSDIRYFFAIVKLDTLPRGLLPGMSAEVAIQTVRRPDVLTVPTEALTVEEGHDVCYVACDDHLERREVQIGQATQDLLEVTAGLDEGDAVVLDPTHCDGLASVTTPATEAEGVEPISP